MKFVDGRTMLEMEYATITGDIEFDLDWGYCGRN